MKRMTDERMAEIEATLYEDTDNVDELLQALKVERKRIAELEAAGLKMCESFQRELPEVEQTIADLKDRIAELEAGEHADISHYMGLWLESRRKVKERDRRIEALDDAVWTLEKGLTHIARHFGSAEQCRELAQMYLAKRNQTKGVNRDE